MKKPCLVLFFFALVLFLVGSRQNVRAQTSAASLRVKADVQVKRKEFGAASQSFRAAALRYKSLGDYGAYKVLEEQAQRYETQISLFYEKPLTEQTARKYYTGKRLEPLYGVYLGAFIDREDGVKSAYQDENGQTHRDSNEWNRIMGKNHAMFFMYERYGNKFPQKWMDHLKRYGGAAQWVLTPDNLDKVSQGKYLLDLAFAARDSGIPIFLRFAGEMNGAWVPYHGDPAKYIQKFRLVAEVFHAYAPNVAMVWCPNDGPEDKITRYYPGEAAVDWVGVNFYNVPYFNADASKPAKWKNPADSLKFIYQTYAAKHPIMIGETAASHLSVVDGLLCPDFAADKIGQLYSSLPRLYPRVKAINWLSMNTLKYARQERQLNNYSLLDVPAVAIQYRDLISLPYFLEEVSREKPAQAPLETLRLSEGMTLRGIVPLSAWVKSYEQRPMVTFFLDGKMLKQFRAPGHYRFALDTQAYAPGTKTLTVEARDSRNKLAGKQTLKVKFIR